MSIELFDYEIKAREGVKTFWGSRTKAKQRQEESGKEDQGERGSVTSGKNMDGFLDLVTDVVRANGPKGATIHLRRKILTLPGFFRSTKLWDLLVTAAGELIASVELKSHVGPSFGKNFNNRTEEALGTSLDIWTAYREGALGKQPQPFVGWLILVEDAPASRKPIKDVSPHFPIFPEFKGASYIERYDLLCQKMVAEKLYTAAAVIASPRSAAKTGRYSEVSKLSGLRAFVSALAGHCAAAATRRNESAEEL